MSYITITDAQLRTKSGNKAGRTQINAIIELSGKTIWMYEDTWHEISSANYLGKYIQMKYLLEYTPPPPPPDNKRIVKGWVELTDGTLVEMVPKL